MPPELLHRAHLLLRRRLYYKNGRDLAKSWVGLSTGAQRLSLLHRLIHAAAAEALSAHSVRSAARMAVQHTAGASGKAEAERQHQHGTPIRPLRAQRQRPEHDLSAAA